MLNHFCQVWASFVWGVGLMTVQLLISMKVFAFTGPVLGFVFKNSLYSGVFAMVGGLIIVPIVSALTKKSRPDKVDEMFECYNKKVLVPAEHSLEED